MVTDLGIGKNHNFTLDEGTLGQLVRQVKDNTGGKAG
jgi:hypothetical protein